MSEAYEHIFIEGLPDSERFRSAQGSGGERNIPIRDRDAHSAYLIGKFDSIYKDNILLKKERDAVSLPSRNGTYLEFKGSVGKELVTASLESLNAGIRLLNIREEEIREEVLVKAIVYIPKGKESIFINKIKDYSDSSKDNNGKPKNANLVNSIDDISLALLESMWTDSIELMPKDNLRWCEVWLRIDVKEDYKEQLNTFTDILDTLSISYKHNFIEFDERAVILVFVNNAFLIELLKRSDQFAEIRIGQEVASLWTDTDNIEQTEWVDDLLSRLNIVDSNVSVCILDTGVNNGHPLIEPLLDESNCLTVNDSWGTADVFINGGSRGHGTLMAGIVAYGDVQKVLESQDSVLVTHKLCSVKILPRVQNDTGNQENWGAYTEQAVLRSRIKNPERVLLYCMAVTSQDDIDKGSPSSWSGSVDKLCFGIEDDKKLFILSGGNINDNEIFRAYPDGNLSSSIQNPAQAWNALTVGAYTDKTIVEDELYREYNSLAPKGGLSPFSTTSLIWNKKWPIKPEIVFEGGNILKINSKGLDEFCNHEDLEVLTTSKEINFKKFDTICATSSATAQASWLAAKLASTYPNIWPETIRALMVHSASWTEEMKRQFGPLILKRDYNRIVRICGYGVPNIERALNSFENGITYIAENEIQPFIKEKIKNKNVIHINDMHLYNLPWPRDLLLSLDVDVKLKITLSYFINPSPGKIGWKDKYRYPSYGLRFALNNVGESKDEFRNRINILSRNQDEVIETTSGSDRWLIGEARDKGSIHSDVWEGTAADIAACNIIAIYPVGGWWKDRPHLKKINSNTRYSLVVSIDTPEVEVELYTTVATMIRVPIEIKV